MTGVEVEPSISKEMLVFLFHSSVEMKACLFWTEYVITEKGETIVGNITVMANKSTSDVGDDLPQREVVILKDNRKNCALEGK